MFSGLSTLLDKPFVLGFFLPSLMGIFGFLFANRDICLFQGWLDVAAQGTSQLGSLVSVLAVVWIFAIFLMALNHWAFQLLEGYIWPLNSERARRNLQAVREVQRELIQRYDVEHETAVSERERIEAVARDSEQLRAALREEARLNQRYLGELESSLRRYPLERDDVLPTRLGNTMRAFEMYSTYVYQADSIYVWPRLTAVIPAGYQSVMAEARSMVDFLVSLITLASITAAVTLGRAGVLWVSHGTDVPDVVPGLLIAALVAAVVARICYEIAISAATRWGDYVKGAFDLYLPVLAQTLGYVLPESEVEQRHFWDEWSTQFRFHDRAVPAGWVRTVAPGGAVAKGSTNEPSGKVGEPPKAADEPKEAALPDGKAQKEG